MTFKFSCPYCFRKIGAQEEFKGAKTECPSCNRTIEVPSPQYGAGKEIGGFVIEQWLGNGAMGEVHLARQAAMDRLVALKIMTNEKMSEDDDKQRFVREIQTLAKLNHPNIVSAISAGEFEDGSYLAMTYITGCTAEDKVNMEGPMSEKDALTCCISVAEALKHAWQNNKVLHRDLKPSNFMIDENNNTLLMDMGIAKSMDNDNDITMAGIVMGTPYYMSPEQARAEKNLDQRSDIYSLGASLYHMVTGIPPYHGGSAMQVMGQKLKDDPIPPHEHNSDLSSKICRVISKFMAIDIDRRPSSWEEVIEILKDAKAPKKAAKKIHVHSHADSSHSRPRPKKQKSSALPLIFASIIIAAGAIAFAILK